MNRSPRLEAAGGDVQPSAVLCDAWTAGGQRRELFDRAGAIRTVGSWPKDLETDAAARLGDAAGWEATWDELAERPAVAQQIGERARLQPLDRELLSLMQHLQWVCHRPRLHLRVEDERMPVTRAKRFPARAVADLISHPGDWERRTLRSIQPRRVLARQVEDEWNLYENRVAVRLVDGLLAYLAGRLEELRHVAGMLRQGRDHGDQTNATVWRATRITMLWAAALDADSETDVQPTIQRLEHAQRELLALTDTPLYRRIPRRESVALALRQTNILVNDPHYRKVAALWRTWARHGYKKQETRTQREERRQREGRAWDRFVLHLVVRGLTALGWTASGSATRWTVEKQGWHSVEVATMPSGVVTMTASSSGRSLCLVPLCAVLKDAGSEALDAALSAWNDKARTIVGVHAGQPAEALDADRATGWRYGDRATLLACSPWEIDSEERMARLIHGWLARHATAEYPLHRKLPKLPASPKWPWIVQSGDDLVVRRAPTPSEHEATDTWCKREMDAHDERARQAKAGKRPFSQAPRKALEGFGELVETARETLAGLETCPVCGGAGRLEPRDGTASDGTDATWWATCRSCKAEWGLRRCTSCAVRYRVLFPYVGSDLRKRISDLGTRDWPDRALGHDVWAKPCRAGLSRAHCPGCGSCSGGNCAAG